MEQLIAFISEILSTVGGWKGMPVQFILSGVLALVVSSLKVDFIRSLLWDRLGAAKVLLAPVLSLLGALVVVQPFTWETVWVALSTGAGAIALYEIVNGLKTLPFVSPLVSKVLDLASLFFKKK
jgi:hypothetical protein